MVIQAIQISQMRRDSSMWKELQSTALALLTDNATWVRSLSAIECAEALAWDAFPNGNHLGFAVTATRLTVQDNMSITILTRPTTQAKISITGAHPDPPSASWQGTPADKRLAFVDLELPDQTGAFYIGSYVRHPSNTDRFLKPDEFSGLYNSLQMELAALWTPGEASHSERQNAMLDIRAGRLFVPCIRLQAAQQEVVEDVDALLLDAVRRDHPTLARWDLDRLEGRPYPAGDGKGHYLALKYRMRDVSVMQKRVLDAQAQQFDLRSEIEEVQRMIGGLAVEDTTSNDPGFSSKSSLNKRGSGHTVPELEEPTSSMSIAPPPPAVAASNDNLSEHFGAPPPAHNESEAFESATPPNTFTSASLPLQQYAELAPVPADLEQGIPLALMSCGYMPRRVAKCLKETFVPSLIAPSSARKSYIAARNTVLWLDTEASTYHRSRALLLQAPIMVDSEWDALKLNRGSWSDGDHKHLLEHYRQPPYDGTSWHGMYERVALPPPLCFLRRDALESIPPSTRVALSQSVPDHLREALKKQMDDGKAVIDALQRQFFGVPGLSDGVDQDENDAGSVYPITISFDELVWSEIIQRDIVKIPVALVKFKSLDLDSLLKLRHLLQGPGYGRTLFVLNPDGTPYLPKAQHVIVLKRYSCTDDLVDMWVSNLAGMQTSLGQLSLRQDSKKV